MSHDDAWAHDVYKTLGPRYNRSVRRPHPDWVTNSSSSNSRGTNTSDNATLLSTSRLTMEGTVAFQSDSRMMSTEIAGSSGEPIDYSCMLPPSMRPPSAVPAAARRDARYHMDGSTQLADEDSDAPWLPMCFYAQMLSTTETHHSVSHPNTPTARDARNFNEAADARHWKGRLSTYARSLQAATLREELEATMFCGVEERATACAAELQDMIMAVRRWNALTLDAQRQLNVSRSINVPRESKLAH